jgi:hypothetical protein
MAAVVALFPPGARTADVHLVVASRLDLARIGERGAVGLYVPGAGATVSRARALRSLLTGTVVSSLIAEPTGSPLVGLSRGAGETTIYVVLPPAGERHNDRRYPIAVVGSGYRGLLTSRSTRIPGLVSIGDVAPTVLALRRGVSAPIRYDRGKTSKDVTALDLALTRAHAARNAATVALAVAMGVLTAIGLVVRSRAAATAAVTAPLGAILAAIVLSLDGVREPHATADVLLTAALVVAAITGFYPSLLPAVVVGSLLVFAALIGSRPALSALAAIGPHPDGGVRFYGVTNQVETLLLAPVVEAEETSRRAVVGVGPAALVAIAWTRTGADTGGLVVVLAGLVTLYLRQRTAHVSRTAIAVAAGLFASVVGVVFLLDVLTGGSSHATRSAHGGPGALLSDLSRRVHVSWAGATHSVTVALLCAAGLAVLAAIALARPRRPAVDAFMVAIACSLLVNDSPVDELTWGALGGTALWLWAAAEYRSPLALVGGGMSTPRVTTEP